jgi:hypothetical protein
MFLNVPDDEDDVLQELTPLHCEQLDREDVDWHNDYCI